jgi:hypothetical protein
VIVHPTKAYLLRDYTQLMAHLDHAREDQGLTRQQLADETPGVSRSQVTCPTSASGSHPDTNASTCSHGMSLPNSTKSTAGPGKAR